MLDIKRLEAKFIALKPIFDERRLRLWAAVEAEHLGHGGIQAVALACGLSRRRIERAAQELESGILNEAEDRVRRPGGGRKSLSAKDPGIRQGLEKLVDPLTRGDPMSALRWTSKSTEKLAQELSKNGHKIGARSVAKLLQEAGYSLQSVRKKLEGTSHEDRDAQFQQINRSVEEFQQLGEPVISIDAKKKELIGKFAKGGQEWRPEGEPEAVNTYDFMDPELGKVTPYGVFDIAANEGWVSVGIDHDTAPFAGEAIRQWWREMGAARYLKAKRILITADGGGSNGVRLRLWKKVLQQLATELNLEIHLRHFPPGTSKWNKIEHRMFSQITHNWRGRALETRQIVVDLIGATTTKAGLRIKAALDEKLYPLKQSVSDEELAAIKLKREAFHGEWNYAISP